MAQPRRGVVSRVLGPGKYIIGLAIVAAAAWYWFGNGDAAGGKPAYRLAKIETGTISNIVTASGTLKALITVDVGTQISGQVKQLMADFNTEVKAGQVIARIDPATFEAKVREIEADVATAKGNVHPMFQEIVSYNGPMLEAGHIPLSEKPGIGVEINEEGMRKYAQEGVPFFE
jgi:HlyD family secretion protein